MKRLILAGALIIAMSNPVYAAYERTLRTPLTIDANTTQYTYTPITGNYPYRSSVGDESRIDNLDHYSYYTWGMELGVNLEQVSITGASITFNQIRNWDTGAYDLWVRLIDHNAQNANAVSDGIREYGDSSNTDALAGNGIELNHFSSISGTGDNRIPGVNNSEFRPELGATITYTFDAGELLKLIEYAEDGVIGLGFDPDCHFWNEGVTFNLLTTAKQTSEVPEPATMLLFGTGLAGLAGFRMRKKKR